jgi:prepilin-type processing-associated H-X9-DG protein
LPYVEMEDLWQNPNDFEVAGSALDLYICPSLRGPTRFPYSAGNGGWSGQLRAVSDYVGNGGTWGWDGTEDQTLGPGSFDGPFVPNGWGYESGGATDPVPFVTPAMITNGSSNVLLAAEKYLDKAICTSHNDCNDDQGWTDGWDNDAVCWAYGGNGSSNGPIVTPQPDGAIGTCGGCFGSVHPGYMQAVFCDGSVHSISFQIDPDTWANLCSRNNGNPVDAEKLF